MYLFYSFPLPRFTGKYPSCWRQSKWCCRWRWRRTTEWRWRRRWGSGWCGPRRGAEHAAFDFSSIWQGKHDLLVFHPFLFCLISFSHCNKLILFARVNDAGLVMINFFLHGDRWLVPRASGNAHSRMVLCMLTTMTFSLIRSVFYRIIDGFSFMIHVTIWSVLYWNSKNNCWNSGFLLQATGEFDFWFC